MHTQNDVGNSNIISFNNWGIIRIDYAWKKINPLRYEVLGEWKRRGISLYFCVYLYIDQGPNNHSVSIHQRVIDNNGEVL
ncbi:hypothetical protein AA980_17135 [Neobacillus vireti]|nr:hypothetical protein AA980_17135 [Neobacillus vireti]